MNELIKVDVVNGKPSVTSLQVAAAFGKEHFNVLVDIRKILDSDNDGFGALNFQASSYLSEQNKEMPMYAMSKDGFILLVMGYTGPEAMKVKIAYIARFNEMEEALRASNNKPMLPDDYISALRALANEVEAKQLALSERDEAIRTKAEIGNRREATAMATASVAVRKVYALEDELGKGKTYKQVKAIPWLLDVFAPSRGMYTVVGKTLTAMSKEEGLPIERIQSSEFPEGVNAYHVRVIDRLGARLVDDPDMLGKYRRIDDVR